MSNKLMRRGASILAAAAVVAAGLTVGAGPAGASCLGRVAGPTVIESIAECPPDPDWHAGESLENVRVSRQGPLEARLGEEVVFHNSFVSTATTPERYVTEVVDHPPAGFVLAGVYVTWTDWVGDVPNHMYPEVTPVVDPATGAVTISAAGEGWRIPRSMNGIIVNFTYKVPLNAKVGSVHKSGITFKASGFTGTQGWPVMEGTDTKIIFDPITAGSSAFGS